MSSSSKRPPSKVGSAAVSAEATAPAGKKPKRNAKTDKNKQEKVTKDIKTPSSDDGNSNKAGGDAKGIGEGHEKTIAMLSVQERLLRDLECPVCSHAMVEKIVLCSNGHNICNECRGKV